MTTRAMLSKVGACGATGMVFGVLAGIGGLTHGIGEVLQGSVAVDGIILDSWTTGPIARNMGGEPGITVLPTALAAGVATLLFSLAVLAWSILAVRTRRGGLILILLSVGMLLAGGGVGPPLIGILAGVVARWSPERLPRWVERSSARTRRLLARAWLPLFAIAVVNGVFLVLGSLVLVYTIDFNQPVLFERSFYLSIVMLLLMVLTAPAYDARSRDLISVPTEVVGGRASRSAHVKG